MVITLVQKIINFDFTKLSQAKPYIVCGYCDLNLDVNKYHDMIFSYQIQGLCPGCKGFSLIQQTTERHESEGLSI